MMTITKKFSETEEQFQKRRKNEEEVYKPKTDDDFSITGSAVADGLLGLPTSGTAILVDLVTPGGLFDT